eukprot:FR739700.1.p3 GENE.FR739700.1~~FR739700.1.p3  ORF type:complete len:131 (+),score=43.24 FR739700.1:856-1248(+)
MLTPSQFPNKYPPRSQKCKSLGGPMGGPNPPFNLRLRLKPPFPTRKTWRGPPSFKRNPTTTPGGKGGFWLIGGPLLSRFLPHLEHPIRLRVRFGVWGEKGGESSLPHPKEGGEKKSRFFIPPKINLRGGG